MLDSLTIILLVGTLFFGAIIGSFINMLLVRMRTGYPMGGRSLCTSCSEELSWWNLIPLLSYLFQRGRCGSCDAQIPARYFLIELMVSLMWLTSTFFILQTSLISFESEMLLVLSQVLLINSIFSTLVLAGLYDLRHMILPNELMFLSGLGSLVFLILSNGFYSSGYLSALLGAITFSGIFFGLWFFSKGKWIGLGDVKLLVVMGLLLGFAGVTQALFMASLSALSVVGITHIVGLVKKRLLSKDGIVSESLSLKREIPFGPYLILGTWLTFVGVTLLPMI